MSESERKEREQPRRVLDSLSFSAGFSSGGACSLWLRPLSPLSHTLTPLPPSRSSIRLCLHCMSIFNAPRSHGGLATSPDFSGSSGAAAAARQRPSLGWESADDPWTASSHAAAAAVPPASTSSVRPRPVTWTPAPRNAEAGRTSPEESTQQTQLPALYESAWRAAGARQPGDEISIGQLHRIVASSSLGAGVIEAVSMAC